MADERIIRVTLVKSPIGYRKDQRATAEALGLRKLHASNVHRETPQIRGMITKISHLVQVEEVEEAELEAKLKKQAERLEAQIDVAAAEDDADE